MRKFWFGVSALMITGCLEAQIAPDLPQIDIETITIETLAEGLSSPWSVAVGESGEYYVTERGGKLYRIAGANRTEITGLPGDIYAEGQAGLFDIKLAPDFTESGKVYLSYAYGTQKSNGTGLVLAKLSGDKLTDSRVIFRASPPKDTNAHFGGRIAFLPDETLVLTTGEGFKYREAAQDLNSHLGKIVRLTMEGGVPEDNPKLGDKPDVYSYGHRNVQGLAYDAETSTLWAHEHGPRGGDELNIIKPGVNYGWPIATYGIDYNGAKISPYKTYQGMENGVHIWVPSIAPSGLAIYRGDMFPEWEGDALIGGLASRDLRLVGLEDGQSASETVLLKNLESRIRDVRIDKDGAILVLTDDPENGKLLRITPKK
jgi:glucose/arabinose dehydrogenase